MTVLTLRVKKVYLEQIKAGTKNAEYREYKEYYHGLFKDHLYTHLKLHYQNPNDQLTVPIQSITVVNNPFNSTERPPFLKTRKVYKIKIKNK